MVIITIEGVLATSDDLKTAAPTKWGKALYAGLRSQHHVIGLTKADSDIAKMWTKREHFGDWSRIITYNSPIMTWQQWRVDQVREILSEGWEVFFYVDSDVEVLNEVGQLGVCTLAVSYPRMPVGWKEVAAPRSWSNVVATMDNTGRSAP